MRARITLGSDGDETPSLVSLKVVYPRNSYLAYLPRIYQRDADLALFLQHYLALFERVLTGIEGSYETSTASSIRVPRRPVCWTGWHNCWI